MNRQKFLTIVITSSDTIDNESDIISSLIESGAADYAHIRKPEWDIDRISQLIDRIPVKFHRKLRLHDHFALLDNYDLAGIQLNSRNSIIPQRAVSVSKSCHDVEDAMVSVRSMEYVTLSPVFDSISKQGYRAGIPLENFKEKLQDQNVIALGGVVPEKFVMLHQLGFRGAAMLGYVWNNNENLSSIIRNILIYKRKCCNI